MNDMEWIKISERLPENEDWIYFGSESYEATTWGIYLDGKFVNPDHDYIEIRGITHWMPLPLPPEVK